MYALYFSIHIYGKHCNKIHYFPEIFVFYHACFLLKKQKNATLVKGLTFTEDYSRKDILMATIKDIALATGVSATTVSNVIHGKFHRVSPETLQKIRDAIRDLDYVPNMSARALVAGSSKVVGFVNHVVTTRGANFMEDPFHSSAIGSIEQTLRENGYYLMLRTVENADDLLTFLRNWNVDGLFFTGVFKDTFLDAISNLHIPVVLIDSYVRQNHLCNVGLEDFNGSYQAAKHLIENGHRRIAFASPNIKDGGVLQERFLGYKAALAEASIPFDKQLVIQQEMDTESCRLAAMQLLELPDVTGLVVTADIMAAGIMAALRNMGKRIPDDISIVGFDDIAISQLTEPPLTTIHQDMNLKGRLAVDFMLQLLEGHPLEKSEVTLPTHLVTRGSVRSLL